MRPMSIEASSGKNPFSTTRKIYARTETQPSRQPSRVRRRRRRRDYLDGQGRLVDDPDLVAVRCSQAMPESVVAAEVASHLNVFTSCRGPSSSATNPCPVTASRGIRYCVVEGSSAPERARRLGRWRTRGASATSWAILDIFGPLSIAMRSCRRRTGPPVGRSQGPGPVDRVRYAELRSLPGGAHPVVLDTLVVSVLACEMAKREVGEVSLVMEIASEYGGSSTTARWIRRSSGCPSRRPTPSWNAGSPSGVALGRSSAGRTSPRTSRPSVSPSPTAISLTTNTSGVHRPVAGPPRRRRHHRVRAGPRLRGKGAGLSRFIDDMVRVEAAP